METTYANCSKCKAKLVIDHNNYIEGHRDREEVNCPKCGEFITTISTSGIPTATVITTEEAKEIQKGIDEVFGKGFDITK